MKHNLDEAFPFDFRRLLVFTAVCGLYFGPVVNAWFSFLTKIPFPAQLSDTSKVMAMVAIDQTVGAVIVTSGFFYAFELVGRVKMCFWCCFVHLLLHNELLAPYIRFSA
jgi:hypothetical protein